MQKQYQDNVYGANIMNRVITRVHSIHARNAKQRQTAAELWIKLMACQQAARKLGDR